MVAISLDKYGKYIEEKIIRIHRKQNQLFFSNHTQSKEIVYTCLGRLGYSFLSPTLHSAKFSEIFFVTESMFNSHIQKAVLYTGVQEQKQC